MVSVRFLQADGGVAADIEIANGLSVMRAAVLAGVPGIVGECGGQAMCATCHVYVMEPSRRELPPIGPDEDEMLDSTASERTAHSRLSCQLLELQCSELVVRLPERQL